MRGTGPEPEPGELHVRASNRRFFLPCLALEWLSEREGAPVPAREWCRRWLVERCFDPRELDVLVVVEAVEKTKVWKHRWKVRQPAYRERLREVLVKRGPRNGQVFAEVEAVP